VASLNYLATHEQAWRHFEACVAELSRAKDNGRWWRPMYMGESSVGEAISLKYRAFLSYSHKDTGWAKWLHGHIEGFPIDKDLVGRSTPMGVIPKNLRPVFRDRHDFDAGGTLREQTIAALDASAALVIVCSPVSANSTPVNEEVRQFITRHPDRPVIPLIVDGTPGDSKSECFPKALRFAIATDGTTTDQPVDVLAADVRESGDGRDLALAKVIARLIGLAPDEIFRRAERERRRHGRVRNAIIAALALLALAASGSAVYAWQQLKTNEAFLDATLERFTGLVTRALSLSQSYSVPLPVSLGILQEAEGMLDAMAKYGRDTPKLKLRHVGMLLAFADDYRDLGQTAEWERRIEQAQRLMTEVMRVDPGNDVLLLTLAVVDEQLGDLELAKGHLGDALKSYRDGQAIFDRLVRDAPNKAEWQRDLSVSYEKVGDVLAAQDKLADALTSYRDGQAIIARLAEANPDKTEWQEDLSRSYDSVGQVLVRQRNLPEALKSYRASLNIKDRLAKARPNWNTEAAVAVSYERVGDVLVAQGELPEALKFFHDQQAIFERLVKADPNNARWQYNLHMSYERVGDVLVAQDKLADALTSYRYGQPIIDRLVKADPNNGSWQRQLSMSYDHVGDVLVKQDDLPEALTSYRNSQTIREGLVKAAPDNAGWQRDLSMSHEKVGDVLVAQDKLADALTSYQDGFAIRDHLAKVDPGNTVRQRDLSVSYDEIGDVLVAQGNFAEALKSYNAALAIASALLVMDAGNSQWLNDLSYDAGRVGNLAYRAILGRQFEFALKAADEAIAHAPDKMWLYINRAHALMLLGRVGEARALYLKYRGRQKVMDDKSWEVAVLEDFAEMSKASLSHPLMDEIKQDFSKPE
jgi:tetratricopeptide (TPR) repeat protein